MKRLAAAAIGLALAGPALATEPTAIRAEFDPTINVGMSTYAIASAGLKAAGFNVGLDLKPFMHPTYLDEVAMDPALEEAVQDSMSEELRDPFSAKYRRVRLKAGADQTVVLACGEVNAKNGFGAYVGYQPFVSIFLNPYLDEEPAFKGYIRPWAKQQCRLLGM